MKSLYFTLPASVCKDYLPWGDENLAPSATTGSSLIAIWIKDAADKIAATERAQAALRIIFSAALTDIVPPTLPPEVVDAYQVLQGEAGLEAGGLAAAPGSDAENFDPERSYQQALEDEAISFGQPGLGGLLSPLRQLSFWKMKARARAFGESGAASLLRNLQPIAGERDIRFHLMGHSFGCIVVSAAVAGASGNAGLERPVHSLFLVQGALSLWSYCANIPVAQGRSGYFHSLIRDGRVAGPIVTTHSVHDTAVGRLYPLAAGLKEQVDFAPGVLPKYGALGAYGARGLGIPIEDCKMLPVQDTYHFEAGKLYNLESSRFICAGGGLSGAHNDIAKAEVAHAFWSAVTE